MHLGANVTAESRRLSGNLSKLKKNKREMSSCQTPRIGMVLDRYLSSRLVAGRDPLAV